MNEEEGGFVVYNLDGIRFYCLDHARYLPSR